MIIIILIPDRTSKLLAHLLLRCLLPCPFKHLTNRHHNHILHSQSAQPWRYYRERRSYNSYKHQGKSTFLSILCPFLEHFILLFRILMIRSEFRLSCEVRKPTKFHEGDENIIYILATWTFKTTKPPPTDDNVDPLSKIARWNSYYLHLSKSSLHCSYRPGFLFQDTRSYLVRD